MISISYTVVLENPIKDRIKLENNVQQNSTLYAYVNKTGLIVDGTYTKGTKKRVAASQASIGNTKQYLKSDGYISTNMSLSFPKVEDVFKEVGKKFSDISNNVKSFINTLKHVKDKTYALDICALTKSDFVVLKIDKEGNTSLVEFTTNPPSYYLQINDDIDIESYYVYIQLCKSAELGDYNYLHIPLNKLINYSGFLTIEHNTPSTSKHTLVNKDKGYLLTTSNSVLTFSPPIILDGVLTNTYEIDNKETVKLSFINDLSMLIPDVKYEDNVTLIYKITPTGRRNPKVMVVSTSRDKGYTTDSKAEELFNKLKQSNSEDLKSYVYEQAYTELMINDAKHFLDNKEVLKNIEKFTDKVVII